MNGDEPFIITDAAHIIALLTFLRDDPACRFEQLIDVCGVDYPDQHPRFEVVYQLLSLQVMSPYARAGTSACILVTPQFAGLTITEAAKDLYGVVPTKQLRRRRVVFAEAGQG